MKKEKNDKKGQDKSLKKQKQFIEGHDDQDDLLASLSDSLDLPDHKVRGSKNSIVSSSKAGGLAPKAEQIIDLGPDLPDGFIDEISGGPNKNGLPLARALQQERSSRGETIEQMAENLGMSKVVLLGILNRTRKLAALNWDVLRKLADYLEISPIAAAQMAGAISAQDFSVQTSIEEKISLMAKTMRADKRWGIFVPSEDDFDKLPVSVRLGFVLMYKEIYAKELDQIADEVGLLNDAPIFNFEFEGEEPYKNAIKPRERKKFED